MTIYFVKPGDSLWKIAKKFRTTVENIAGVNGIEKYYFYYFSYFSFINVVIIVHF